MAKADGSIVIDVQLDADGMQKGTASIEEACKKAAQSAELIGDKAKIAAAKAIAAYNRQRDAVAQQTAKVNALREKLEQMQSTPVKAAEYQAVSDEVDKLNTQLAQALEKKQAFLDGGGNADSKQFSALEQQITQIRDDLAAALNDKKRMEEYGNAYVPQDTSSVASQLGTEMNKLDRMNEQLNIAQMSLERVANATAQASAQTGEYGRQLSEAAKSQKDVPGKDSEKKMGDFGTVMKKGIGSLLKYGLGIRSLYMLFRKLRTAITDGIKNLAQYSSTANASMSSIKTSLTLVKNSLATAFQPILTAVAPTITKLCNLLAQAITYVGMLFTALSGGTKFTKAIAAQADYAKSLAGTSAAAKEARQQLSGLDEINTWQESSGSSGNGSPSPSQMFEDVQIDDNVLGIAGKIKAAFEPVVAWFRDSFITPTQKWISELNFEPFVSSAKEMWQQLQPMLSAIGGLLGMLWNDILLPILGWVVETLIPASNQLTAAALRLITSVLRPLINGIKALWDGLQPVIQWIKDVVLLIIQKTGELFAKLAAVFEEKGDKIVKIFDGIGKIISVVWGIVQPIFVMLEEIVGAVFDFIGDIVSTVIGTVIDILAGIIDFIAGVFTGDWDRAWEGIKSIFISIWELIKGVLTGAWEFIKTVFTSIWEGIKGVMLNVWELIKGVLTSIWEFIKGILITIWEFIKGIFITIWEFIKGIFITIWEFIKNIFITIWDFIKGVFTSIWNGIKGVALNIWNFIKNLITTLVNFFVNAKEKILSVFRSIKEKVLSILTALSNALKKPINAIIGAINKMISGVCSGINTVIRALNKLHFDIPDWVPLLGGKTFGFDIREVSAPQIPLLATGAVIPPNAPFAAILGDQRHGNNIETPEALLRQVVREESGGSAQYQFVAQLNRRTIFQEIIDEAKLRQASSGVNPFLLGRT